MHEDTPKILIRFVVVLVLLLAIGVFLGRYLFRKYPSFVMTQTRKIPVQVEPPKRALQSPVPAARPPEPGTDAFGYPLQTADKIQLRSCCEAGITKN